MTSSGGGQAARPPADIGPCFVLAKPPGPHRVGPTIAPLLVDDDPTDQDAVVAQSFETADDLCERQPEDPRPPALSPPISMNTALGNASGPARRTAAINCSSNVAFMMFPFEDADFPAVGTSASYP